MMSPGGGHRFWQYEQPEIGTDDVPPEVKDRIAAHVFDEVKRHKRIDQARERADLFLWSVELKVSAE